MRMPFIEFITSGDLKFIIVFIIFSVIAIYHFIKKLQSRRSKDYLLLMEQHNSKINSAAFGILVSSILSLLLGLLHSFYFIGKAGGVSSNLVFQGISYTLITPVLGICLYMICKILSGILNPKMFKI